MHIWPLFHGNSYNTQLEGKMICRISQSTDLASERARHRDLTPSRAQYKYPEPYKYPEQNTSEQNQGYFVEPPSSLSDVPMLLLRKSAKHIGPCCSKAAHPGLRVFEIFVSFVRKVIFQSKLKGENLFDFLMRFFY